MILTCFRYIFLIMALASNLVVCMAMVKTKDHRKTLSKFFIFQLAVVDVAFRILECYELISERVTDGALGLTHCKIIVFVQYICAAVIFSLLAGIALDRSKNIIYPLQSFKTRSYNHRKKALLLIWLCSIAVSAGFLLTATSVRFSRRFGAEGNRNSSISGVKTNVSGGEFLFHAISEVILYCRTTKLSWNPDIIYVVFPLWIFYSFLHYDNLLFSGVLLLEGQRKEINSEPVSDQV